MSYQSVTADRSRDIVGSILRFAEMRSRTILLIGFQSLFVYLSSCFAGTTYQNESLGQSVYPTQLFITVGAVPKLQS